MIKMKNRKRTGVKAYVPTSQTPRNAPAIVPAQRSIALSAVDPTKREFIITSAVKTDQFGCSNLSAGAPYNESREARLSLIPYRTRRSEKSSARGKSWALV